MTRDEEIEKLQAELVVQREVLRANLDPHSSPGGQKGVDDARAIIERIERRLVTLGA